MPAEHHVQATVPKLYAPKLYACGASGAESMSAARSVLCDRSLRATQSHTRQVLDSSLIP